MSPSQLQALRRIAASFVGSWTHDGRDVFNAEGSRICTVFWPGLADYLCRLHKAFLPLSNAYWMLKKALRDRMTMRALMARDEEGCAE
jgi:hypothetical protein